MPRHGTSTLITVVDTGVLFAAADDTDNDHVRCLQVLQRRDLELVIPALVVAEVSYFLNRRFGPAIEAGFIRGLVDFEVEAPARDEWLAIANLIERYGNFPLGATDASIVVLAERLNTDVLLSLDRRHFSAISRRDGRPFTLLPE